MTHWDALSHVCGKTPYLDDLPFPANGLHVVPFDSPVAHGHVRALDIGAALAVPGVVAILTARDIPGENQIGGIIPDEPLLADHTVEFRGQPLALVVAESNAAATKAAGLIQAEIEALPVCTDPREAAARGDIIGRVRTFEMGDVSAGFASAKHVFSGRAEVGGQEHLYLETQATMAFPTMHDGVRIISSTQGPTAVQRTTARVLGLPMHAIEVEVTRLGGGFGGKEDQATPWAVMVALVAHRFKRPAKLVLDRLRDLRMTGKRHPYQADYQIGLDADLNIVAYQATFFQNAGAHADLSPAVLERTLFHCTNAYRVPNVKAVAMSCKTHVPPNTAFRGFGGPQGMFVMESALCHAAESLGIPTWQLQKKNLLRDGDVFAYGQTVSESQAQTCWDRLESDFQLAKRWQQVEQHNQTSNRYKRGLAVMPICFGISFTKTHMNQGSALLHVYTDGSVLVSTGAVEMGQGVVSKLRAVAASALGVPAERVKIEYTNTTRNANTSPSAASATADLNGKALDLACQRLIDRFRVLLVQDHGGKPQDYHFHEGKVTGPNGFEMTFDALALHAHFQRVSLSEQAFYSPHGLHFDLEKEKGHPFAYHVYGAALVETTLDSMLGTYSLDRVSVVHDLGRSLVPIVDQGQLEGGLVQGLGWMTCEEVAYDESGRLRSHALSTYKVPDLYAAPKEIELICLESNHSYAIRGSKAVGEPPLMYGIGGYFALRHAIRAQQKGPLAFHAPMTPERALLALHTPVREPAPQSVTNAP
ncbi:MAG: molybdopterin-dependent oxidoreductase [Acidobacteria bacterium]|nr:molybdopterin-dependent oxidoreductase [Acidobacteriota bacterium]